MMTLTKSPKINPSIKTNRKYQRVKEENKKLSLQVDPLLTTKSEKNS
jgi:hypothetical protein